MHKKTLIAMFVVITAISVGFTTSINSNVTAEVSSTVALDWDIQLPNEIRISPGESVIIPAKFYGSVENREIDIVIAQADPRFGGAATDLDNPKLPKGFSIDWPVNKMSMTAIPDAFEIADREIGTTNMILTIDENTEPGTYLLGIHMIDNDKRGSDGQTIDYIYVYVE